MADVRPVLVAAKFDVLDATGNVLVTAGSEGRVVDLEDPPIAGRIRVEFPNDNLVWLKPEQVVFRDGALGLFRAVLQFRSVVLADAEFSYLLSRDLVIDGRLGYSGNSITLKTDDGYQIRIYADANSDLRVEYSYIGVGL